MFNPSAKICMESKAPAIVHPFGDVANMGSVICKVYGVVDLLAALLLMIGSVPIPDIFKYVMVAIFVIKGVPSLFG